MENMGPVVGPSSFRAPNEAAAAVFVALVVLMVALGPALFFSWRMPVQRIINPSAPWFARHAGAALDPAGGGGRRVRFCKSCVADEPSPAVLQLEP
jgi:hypothetical protein